MVKLEKKNQTKFKPEGVSETAGYPLRPAPLFLRRHEELAAPCSMYGMVWIDLQPAREELVLMISGQNMAGSDDTFCACLMISWSGTKVANVITQAAHGPVGADHLSYRRHLVLLISKFF